MTIGEKIIVFSALLVITFVCTSLIDKTQRIENQYSTLVEKLANLDDAISSIPPLALPPAPTPTHLPMRRIK